MASHKYSSLIRLATSPLTVCIVAYLLISSFIYNYAFNTSDEGFFVYNAKLISLGKIPYRDFFVTTTPGIYYVQGLLMKLFGPYIVIDRLLQLAFVILLLVTLSFLFPLPRKWKFLYLGLITYASIYPAAFATYNVAFTIAIVSFLFLYKGIHKKSLINIGLAALFAGVTYIFKQSIGGLIIPSFVIILVLYMPRKLLLRSLGIYFGVITGIALLYVSYFFFNHALSQMVYYTFSFASTIKGFQSDFITHRLLFIPVFIICFRLFLRLNKKHRKVLLVSLALLSILYLLWFPRRLGRLIDYLDDPVFYEYTSLLLVPLVIISLPKKDKLLKDCSMYSIFILTLFLGAASSGYAKEAIGSCLPILIPMVIYLSGVVKEKYSLPSFRVQLGALVIILVSVLPIIHSPFPTYAPAFFDYRFDSFTESFPTQETALLRFNPEDKEELLEIISYVDAHVDADKPIFCFPYCPMMYVLTNRPSASYYSLFHRETFLEKDQPFLINELKSNKPQVVITQQWGTYRLISDRNLEKDTLKDIYEFIDDNYEQALVTKNFVLHIPLKKST